MANYSVNGLDGPSQATRAPAYIEVETGLKRRVDDLQERITKFASKPFVVLVPNTAVAEEYRKKLANAQVTVKTLREFLIDSRL
jgi:hypothetical protein